MTCTLCLSRRGERASSFKAVGTWEVYEDPLCNLPLTAPVDEMVAVEI
jgi:hypothetical protein